ncbi:MAG: autotransporter domain-containing protein [Betaproteobacteria bacterium]|nr:autotransporter domain-containing protein [Betaproteobacteria bacterium]
MRSLRSALRAGAIVYALCSCVAYAQYSNVYVFGDSLSDAGQYGARFTTNPGLTAFEYLAQRYGLSVGPSFTGGNDFAQGGARVNAAGASVPPNVPNLSVAQQVSQLLARGPLDTGALYAIQGGGNDIQDLLLLAGAGRITSAQLQAGVAQAATDLATQAGRLRAAGARNIVVQNVPDLGKTPRAAALGAQATLTSLSGLFNSTLDASLAAGNSPVVQVNIFGLLNEFIANPAAFGFTNVTVPVCTTASALQCTPSTLRELGGNLTYVFSDSFHGTTGTYLAAAAAIAALLEGPQQIAALGEAPLAVERANYRALDSRMMSASYAPLSPRKTQAWAVYDYGNDDFGSGRFSGEGDSHTITVGGDMRLSDRLLAGVAFGYTEYKGDLGGSGGSFTLKEPTITAYAGYGEGPWWVGATVGGGSLDYSNVSRNLGFGTGGRGESGDTRGYHIIGRVLGGYWFKLDQWNHGPFAKLTYQEATVRAFSENGTSSTGLRYGQQRRESLIGSLGWQASGDINGFRPFARVTWEFETEDDARQVTASPIGLSGSFAVPGYRPDDNYGLFNAGVARDFGGVTGFVYGSGTTSKSDGDYWGVTLGIRVPL